MKNENNNREHFIKVLKDIIATENPNIADRLYRMTLARMKLEVSENCTDALLWMIRFLVRTHPDPQSAFEDAIEICDEHRNEMVWITTIMENEVNCRYKELKKGKDRK